MVVEPTGSEIQVVAKLGGAGDDRGVPRTPSFQARATTIRLKPDPRLVHLFDPDDRETLNAYSTLNEHQTGGTTMTGLYTPHSRPGRHRAAAAGALTGSALLDWAKAWAQDSAVEAGSRRAADHAALEVLRAGRRRRLRRDVEAFTRRPASRSRSPARSYDDVQPKASVAANTGAGPDMFWGLIRCRICSREMLPT